jgi:hypothetical protein
MNAERITQIKEEISAISKELTEHISKLDITIEVDFDDESGETWDQPSFLIYDDGYATSYYITKIKDGTVHGISEEGDEYSTDPIWMTISEKASLLGWF